MDLRVTRDRFKYRFDKALPPEIRVAPGSVVTFETYDASTGRLNQEEDVNVYVPDMTRTNPVTGPVYLKEAAPGDTVVAAIERIEPAARGFAKVLSGLDRYIPGSRYPHIRFARVEGADGVFLDRFRFPLRPMVGTLGCAPAGDPVATGYHFDFGGNMDLNVVREGSRVYLPVAVEGALFSLGDVHAAIGDGEVTASGWETLAEVRVRLDLLRGRAWPRPWVDAGDQWATYGWGESMETAGDMAVADMVRILGEQHGLSVDDANVFLGMAGDLRAGHTAAWGIGASVYLTVPKLRPLSP